MKKLKKKLTLVGFAFSALVLLAGCVQTVKNSAGELVPTGQGWVYNILVRPMSAFVDLFAIHSDGTKWLDYGWAIIIVTLIIRLILLPLSLNQQYKSTYMQEKTAYLAPVFAPLNERMKRARANKDQQGMMEAQQALLKAQKDNGINMMASIGCLPILLQYPFFIALYNAARYTNGINSSTFFGINLGSSSGSWPGFVLIGLAAVFYALQSVIMYFGMPEEQRKQQKMMLIISPAMIVFFSFASPSGVTLYWVAGGLIIVLQQVIVTYFIKPRLKVKIDREFKENPPKMTDLPKDVTPVASSAKVISTNRKSNKAGRNAGRQKK
ncbi:MAG TPA: membrane protein insertase YidC [Lactovum miscens]|uniref:membrane protein insertase YidC n=1 Tax=Lactovum miscens TaxID=190387 RepID=UPI002ED7F1A8